MDEDGCADPQWAGGRTGRWVAGWLGGETSRWRAGRTTGQRDGKHLDEWINGYINGHRLICFPLCWDKIPNTNTLKEERFIWSAVENF